MKRRVVFMGMILVLAVVWPASALDEKQDETDPAQPANNKDKPLYARELTGRVTRTGNTTRTFTLRVEYVDLQPNAGYRNGTAASREVQHLIRQQQELARLQSQIMTTRNPAKRAAKLQNFANKVQRQQMTANAQHLPYRVVTRHENLELQATEDVQVRVKNPPVDYDEKGNAKKYSAEELRKLKGPGNLWGFPALWGSVQKGQEIKVFLTRNKKTATPDDEPKSDKVKETKRPEVGLIYILADTKNK